MFGWGSPLDRWLAALCTRARWACFGAFDGNRLVGTGAAHFAGALGWLGAAGTLEDARGRGAQSALLAARIRAAGDAGARVLATETVDRVDGVAGPSFRNVVRAGFEEAYVQGWWVPTRVGPRGGQARILGDLGQLLLETVQVPSPPIGLAIARRSARRSEQVPRHIFQKLSLPEGALENKRVRPVLTYLRA